jgi:hypothetical protein
MTSVTGPSWANGGSFRARCIRQPAFPHSLIPLFPECLVDLAFLAANLGKKALRPGLESAERVYGSAVGRHLRLSLDGFQQNRAQLAASIKSLAISDTQTLRRGLRTLRSLTGDVG